MKTRAFTLIELMVVLAIIGVLTAVVLGLLTKPRSEAGDASIKADFRTIIAQSAIYYDSVAGAQSYGTVTTAMGTNAACATAGSLFLDPTIAAAITNADKNSITGAGSITCSVGKNLTAIATPGTKAQDWSMYLKLSIPIGGFTGWCADATGIEKADNALPTVGTNYDCP